MQSRRTAAARAPRRGADGLPVQRCVQLAPPAEAEAEVVEVVEREEAEGLQSGG